MCTWYPDVAAIRDIPSIDVEYSFSCYYRLKYASIVARISLASIYEHICNRLSCLVPVITNQETSCPHQYLEGTPRYRYSRRGYPRNYSLRKALCSTPTGTWLLYIVLALVFGPITTCIYGYQARFHSPSVELSLATAKVEEI